MGQVNEREKKRANERTRKLNIIIKIIGVSEIRKGNLARNIKNE